MIQNNIVLNIADAFYQATSIIEKVQQTYISERTKV